MSNTLRNSVLQSIGGTVITGAVTSQFTNAELAVQFSLLVGTIWFGVALVAFANQDAIDYATKRYAEYRNNQDIQKYKQTINNLIREVELAYQELEDLIEYDTPTAKAAVDALAHRLIVDHYQYGLSMAYNAVTQRKACSRADWDHVHALFVEAGIKTKSGTVIPATEEEAWTKYLGTMNASKKYIVARNGELVKGYKTT